MRFTLDLCFFFSLASVVVADIGLEAAEEFHSFVTRPDLKPPKYNITYHDKSRLAPGYWFVSPYNLHGNHLHDVKWQSCQCGPTIYDNDGELVWSGACDFPNKIVWNFRPSEYWEGGQALTGVMQHSDTPRHDVGAGWFLGDDYKVHHSVVIEENSDEFDLHEFNLFANGRRALVAFSRESKSMGSELGIAGTIRTIDNGFREIDTLTGRTLFEWHCLDWLSPSESTAPIGEQMYGTGSRFWDPFHLNSVDKNEDGNYLVSLRHADTILLVDGLSGEIVWRAGGVKSDFEMRGFVWSRQHHPRFLESTQDYTLISFVDNAASGKMAVQEPTNPYSRGMVVMLNHPHGIPTTARLLNHYNRPDLTWSVKRGSMQLLPNSNVFVTWSQGGYLTEYSEDGEPLMEARWLNDTRFGTYRGYKFDGWVGRPRDSPVLAARTVGTDDISLTTLYVSWNGATEVAMWEFYEWNDADLTLLGCVNRTGFETEFVTEGRPKTVVAKALDRDGEDLGSSGLVETESPYDSDDEGVPEGATDSDEDAQGWIGYVEVARKDPKFTSAVLVAVVLVGLAVAVLMISRRRAQGSFSVGRRGRRPEGYEAIPKEEEA